MEIYHVEKKNYITLMTWSWTHLNYVNSAKNGLNSVLSEGVIHFYCQYNAMQWHAVIVLFCSSALNIIVSHHRTPAQYRSPLSPPELRLSSIKWARQDTKCTMKLNIIWKSQKKIKEWLLENADIIDFHFDIFQALKSKAPCRAFTAFVESIADPGRERTGE